jgi:hypothetical protein
MKLFSHPIMVFVGLSLAATGCVSEPIDDDLATTSELTPMGGGVIWQNGLLPLEYQSRRSLLDALLKKPLLVGGVLNPDPAFSDFIADASGKKVFTYTVECALPAGMVAGGFTGAGLLATTKSWVDFPLTLQQRRDVHTCVTTRLNPLGDHVNIWLGGPDTAQDTAAGAFGESEALWSVDVNIDGMFKFYVWPLETFTAYSICGNSTTAMLADVKSRLCDNSGPLCAVVLRNDMATACKGSPGMGDWVCDGKPAIETRLKEADWGSMHPKCPLSAPLQ